MPNVTINAEDYQKFDLKSAPPDGFVMLRPLPYSMLITRRDKALKMRMIQQRTKRNQKPQAEEQVIDLEQMGDWSTQFDFTYCIGEHNLTDVSGALLQFNDQRQIAMTLRSLDPRVGSEIEKFIDQLNNPEDDELVDDFLRRQNSSSENGLSTSKTDLSGVTDDS